MLSVTSKVPGVRLTPYQQQVSTMIQHSVPEIPGAVSELIGAYASDYSLAGQQLIFSDVGKILNLDVRNMIKSAFISDDCKVSIKQLIFGIMKKYQIEHNLQLASIADLDKMPTPDFYRSSFSTLCSDINEQGGRINLDDGCLDEIRVAGCLSNMTAKRAVFKQIQFSHVQMKNADLTGATLDNSHFFRSQA